MKRFIVYLLIVLSLPAYAELNIIVPFAVAGSIDATARQFQKWITLNTKETVVVENVNGGGGYVGLKKLDTASPNTVVITSSSLYINSIEKDFPIETYKYAAILGETPLFLVVRKESNLSCEKLRTGQRQFFFGTGGKNSQTSFATLMVQKKYKNVVEVPYKGGGQAMIDLLSGQIDATFITNLDRNDDLVFLANTSGKVFRSIPSLRECLGITQTQTADYILLTSGSASDEFIRRLNQLAIDFAKDPETIKWAEHQGTHLLVTDVSKTHKMIRERHAKWKSVIEKE